MDYLDRWRARLAPSFRAFASIGSDPGLDLQHGVLAASVLWAVREDAGSPALAEALSALVGTPVEPLLDLLGRLGPDPQAAARLLAAEAHDDPRLSGLLDRLALRFVDDYVRLGLLQRPDISITGGVSGANVVINGQQYIAGDLVVTRPRTWSRPTAPAPPPHFAGRSEELGRLETALAEGRSVAVTGVQGMAGIGKTSLVLQAASRATGFGAVLWASLGPDPTVGNHLLGWARHGDDAFEAGDSPLDVLAARVRSVLTQLVEEHCPGGVLVVLDDVWEGESVRAARLLQQAAPAGATLLITTRSQRVVAQLRSSRLELQPLTAPDALLMLRKLLVAHPDVRDTDLADLAATVQHHPLALELAAGQVQLLERPADEVGSLIEKYREGVPAGTPFDQIDLELGEDREDNLEVVLAYSYDSLSPTDQARFRALGVLAYGVDFDRGLCAALWGTADATEGLDALRHRALLGIAPEPGWYQQHALLRAYARSLLATDKDRETVVARYCDHVVDVSGGFATLDVGAWGPLEAMVPHVEEVGGILAADVAATVDPKPAAVSRGLGFALSVRHLLARRRELHHPEWLQMGLSLSRRARDLARTGLFLSDLGADELFRGRPRDALQRLTEARSIAEHSLDRPRIAQISTLLAEFHLSSDPELVPEHLRRAIDLYDELGDRTGLVRALLVLARWHTLPDAPDEQRRYAEAVLREAAAVAEGAGDAEGAVEVLLQLGRLHDRVGSPTRALEELEAGLEAAAGLGRSDLEGLLRLFAASAAASAGRLPEAEAHLRAAVPLFRSTGHRAGQATALRNLAQLCASRGEHEAALDHFAEALPLVRRVTMEFLDTDERDRETAPSYFWAEYEDVVKLDVVETFRATVLRTGSGSDEPAGWVADDLVYHLLRQTTRAARGGADDSTAWCAAVHHLESRLAESGPAFAPELAFVAALRSLLGGRVVDLAEDNVYRTYLDELSARLQDPDLAAGLPLIEQEAAFELARSVLVTRLVDPEQAHDQMVHLRRQRRLAACWGDQSEHELYAALLLVLVGRPAALPQGNPYRPQLEWLQSALAEYEVPPVDWLLQEVTADATDPQRRADRLRWLTGAAEEALVRTSAAEADLLRGLAALLSGDDVELAPGHPFAAALSRARTALRQGGQVTAPLPPAGVTALVGRVVAARTREPKTVDLVREELEVRGLDAERVGDADASSFVRSLQELLEGRAPGVVGGGPYEAAAAHAARSIAEGEACDPALCELPPEVLERLVLAGTAAALPGPEADDELRLLRDLRAAWATRGPGWAGEVALADDLLAIAGGGDAAVRPGNRYQAAVEQVRMTVGQQGHAGHVGAPPQPPSDDRLTDDLVLRALTADEDTFAGHFRGLVSGRTMVVDQLDRLLAGTVRSRTVTPEGRQHWQEGLTRWRSELDVRAEQLGADAQAEAELLTSLIAIVGDTLDAVPTDHPYADHLEAVVRAIAAYDAGEDPPPGQLSRQLIHDLTVVTGSAQAVPERLSEWQEMLVALRSRASELRFDVDAVAFLDALLAQLDGRPTDLPLANLYQPFLHVAWQIGAEAARAVAGPRRGS